MKSTIHAEEALIKLFGSTSRARILDFLCRHSGRSFYQRKVMYETGLSFQTVQGKLSYLAESEIFKEKENKARVYYEVDKRRICSESVGHGRRLWCRMIYKHEMEVKK